MPQLHIQEDSSWQTASRATRVLFVSLVLAVGCGKTPTTPADKTTKPKVHEKSEQELLDDETLPEETTPTEPEKKLTVDDLDVRINTYGQANQLPQYIQVTTAQPVFRSTYDTKRTAWSITPKIKGTFKRRSNDTLIFRPDNGFKPGTTYTFTLESLSVFKNTLKPTKPWTHTFKTPAFELISISTPIRADKETILVDLLFSASPISEDLRTFATWTFADKNMKRASYRRGMSTGVVQVSLKGTFEKLSTLKLDLASGVPFDTNILAGSKALSAIVEDGPEVTVETSYAREGSSSYFVEVICDDKGAPGKNHNYWDRVKYNSYYISSRCMPDADSAASLISFNPKVNFHVSSSGGGFRIFGNFKKGTYAMRIKSGLRTMDGGILRKTFTKRIDIKARTPKLTFTSKGRYLPQDAFDQFAVKHLNINKFHVEVRHIPKSNLVFWLSGRNESATNRVGDVVATHKVTTTHTLDKEGVAWLSLKDLVQKPEPGIYEFAVSGKGQRDTMRVLLTDLNLVAKAAAPKINESWSPQVYVWAFGMHKLAAKPGVNINLIRPSGKVISSCSTDAAGGCVLEVPPRKNDSDAAPFAILASLDKDFTYLKYSELKTPLHGNTSGKKYTQKFPYEATIYADRDLYRPGDKGHFVGIIRKRNWSSPSKAVPVEMTLRDARSRVVKRRIVKTNTAGLVELNVVFGDFALTGHWSLSLKIGKRNMATYRFGVEEFVPERMSVNAHMDRDNYLSNGQTPIKVEVEAKYLFGGSTKGSKVELHCRLEPGAFKHKKHKDYTFHQISEFGSVKSMDLGSTKDTLIDAYDKANIACPGQDMLSEFKSSGSIVARVSVFEAGSGRTTTRTTRAKVHPAPYYIGLRSPAKKAKSGHTLLIEGIVVDWNGEVVNALEEVQLEVLRMVSEYGWYYDPNQGRERYRWHRRPIREGVVKVKVANGRFKTTITPKVDGDALVVRAQSTDQIGADLEIRGSSHGYFWWTRDASADVTPGPKNPLSVSIEAPKTLTLKKDTKIHFTSPYKGRALLTLETHNILSSTWQDVKAGKNTWTIRIDKFAPNIYASVFIAKDPHAESKEAFLPGRATGVASIALKPTYYTHNITLSTPKEIRAEQPFRVSLDLGPQQSETWATVAAVDEGILSLSQFKTPNPNTFFFSKRKLGVQTYDTVGWGVRKEAKTGGDKRDDAQDKDDTAGLGRVKAIKPVALWSGLVKVPKTGKVDVSFTPPLYRGSLRVMAVAASKHRIGSAEAQVLVRDPITLQTTLPRFLSAQDKVHVPVFVSNLSGKTQTIDVSFTASEFTSKDTPTVASTTPAVLVQGEQQQTMTLEDGKSASVYFVIQAMRQSGAATFRIDAKAGDLSTYDEGVVPLIPTGPVERVVKRIKIEQGTTDLTEYLKGWEPTSEHTTFWLTPIPYADAFDHLRYLVRYPYGCIEQTTSSTRPLLFIADILGQVMPEALEEPGSLERMITHGVRRVLSMQTSSGGFAYWPGRRTPDAWGTAYATHMLLDAVAQGYEVPKERLDNAIKWMANNVGNSSYPYAEPYMHYVLARAKKGNRARIRTLIRALPSTPTGELAEREYLLKAALYLLGDHRYERQLKSPDVSALKPKSRRYGHSYYSDRRRRGMILSTFFDLFGKDPKGEALAKLVGQDLAGRSSSYYTTQEMVWGVTGLGKWVQGAASKFDGSALTVAGKVFKPSKTNTSTSNRTWSLRRASEYPELNIDLANKDEGDLFLLISSQGVRTKPTIKYGGKGFNIKRQYFDEYGNRFNPNTHELGDLVFSRITVTNTSGQRIENVAVVERFPSGWEVEHPNPGKGVLPANLSTSLWVPEHKNVRDDRVEAFGTLYPGQSVSLVIALRATSAGTFFSPSAHVEAMYDPDKWGRLKGSKITIKAPWTTTP